MKGEARNEGMRLRACLSELREYVPGKTVRGAGEVEFKREPAGCESESGGANCEHAEKRRFRHKQISVV